MTDISKLFSLFEKYAYAKEYATAFSELLDAILIPFKMCDTDEEREVQLLSLTNHPQKDVLGQLANNIGELAEGFRDPLGDLYMQTVSKGHLGQYFTPEHMCDLMAILSVGISENGKSVLDPACGSGRMLLAAAKINRHQVFYGADIDKVCCKMAVFNMLLQSLTGEIAHMNSLSNEFFTGYQVSTTLHNGYYYPWYRKFTNPEESIIWLRPKVKPQAVFPIAQPAGTYQQGALF